MMANASNGEGESADKQADLEGNVRVGGSKIEAVSDSSDREILGWVVPFTIGNKFTIPRQWLEDQANELDLSHAVLPRETSAKRAFSRAGDFLEDEGDVAQIEKENEGVEVHLNKVPYKSKFRVEFHDRREETEFDGEMLGLIEFDADTENVRWNPQISPDHDLWSAAQEYIGAFKDEFDVQKTSNTGRDIRSMITRFFNSRSQSVRFRAGGGVYFAPVAAEPVVKAFDELVSRIDTEHKTSGFPCELDTIEVADSDEKKSMVEEKVRRELERRVTELVEEAIDDLADEDELTDDLIGDLEDGLQDAESFAERYNALLDAEMTVKEHIESWKMQLSGDAQQLVEEVLGKSTEMDDNEDDDETVEADDSEDDEDDNDDESDDSDDQSDSGNQKTIKTGAADRTI